MKGIGNRITLTVLAVVALGLLGTGILFAETNSNYPRISFLGDNVEVHVASPFAVTPVMSRVTVDFTGVPVTVYPGQKIAEGTIRVENRSPFDYGAYVNAEPRKVLGDTYPYFEIKIWTDNIRPENSKVIAAGTTVEMRIEIFIPYGFPVSSFQGLDVIIVPGPPSTETTMPSTS